MIVKQYSIGETLLGRIRFWTSSYNKIDEGEGSHLTLSVVYGSETAPSWYFSTSDKHNSQGGNLPLVAWKKAFVQNAENEYIALYYRVVIRMIPVHWCSMHAYMASYFYRISRAKQIANLNGILFPYNVFDG